jgi:hypothetical protein
MHLTLRICALAGGKRFGCNGERRDPRGNNAIGNAMGPVGFARPTFLKHFWAASLSAAEVAKGSAKWIGNSYRQLCGLVG